MDSLSGKISEEIFCDLLHSYTKAAIAQNEWDRIAPVGLSASQAKKESRLHGATDRAYDRLWEYVSQTLSSQ